MLVRNMYTLWDVKWLFQGVAFGMKPVIGHLGFLVGKELHFIKKIIQY